MKARHLRCLEHMRDCVWPNDRQPPNRRNWARLAKMLKYFLLTRDSERRRFFLDVMAGTFKINPRAWQHSMRLLSIYVHMHHHFHDKANLLVAPPTKRLLDHAGKPYAIDVIAAAPAMT